MIPTLIEGVVLPGKFGEITCLRFVKVYDVIATSYGKLGAYTSFEISGWLADYKVTKAQPDEFIDLGLDEPLDTSRIISYWMKDDKIYIDAKTMSPEVEAVAKALEADAVAVAVDEYDTDYLLDEWGIDVRDYDDEEDK